MIRSPGDRAPERRHLYIRTFGCQMNEYDSLRVQRLLAPLGYVVVGEPDRADVIFLNTCSVREKAEQKVFSFIGRLRRLKGQRPHLKIVAGGCVAQQLGAKLLERFDHLDMVVGTRGVGSMAEALEKIRKDGGRAVLLPEEDGPEQDGRRPEVYPAGSVVCPVTIMQGCNNFCTYCIVPYVRGPERSRSPRDILREIEALKAAGVREVLLLGQNVNSYGRGLEEKITFAGLIALVAEKTGIPRIRFTTSHPKDLTEDLMRAFAETDSLCGHLHLPVQSGSDRVLARMNRGYTASGYLEKIGQLRRICPEIGLSSDVIVGFPGETEDDFRRTLDLLDAVGFDNLFSFRYSDRPNTRAAAFPDKVDPETGTRRLVELQQFQAGITLARNRSEIGRVREVLVEGPSRASNGQVTGHTRQNRTVNFKASPRTVGTTVNVRITEAFSHSLLGDMVSENGSAAGTELSKSS